MKAIIKESGAEIRVVSQVLGWVSDGTSWYAFEAVDFVDDREFVDAFDTDEGDAEPTTEERAIARDE